MAIFWMLKCNMICFVLSAPLSLFVLHHEYAFGQQTERRLRLTDGLVTKLHEIVV